MTWPDPNCRGPHKPRQRIIQWMHTQECLQAYPTQKKPDDPDSKTIPENATIVERGRAVGAI